MIQKIERDKKEYYEQLKHAQRNINITEWIKYFQEVYLESQICAKV